MNNSLSYSNYFFPIVFVMVFGNQLITAPAPSHNELIVYNKGIGGQNSKQGKVRFQKDVLSINPDFVFIYFGLNDTLNEPVFQSEAQYVENLTGMVEQAKAAGVEPVLCTIHQVDERELFKRHKKESYGTEGPNVKIKRYNQALLGMAAKRKVKIADFAKVVSVADLNPIEWLSKDGVHLTPLGYKALADCFFSVIARQVQGRTQVKIVCLGDSVTYGAGVKGAGTVTGDTYPAYLATRQFGLGQ